MTHDKQICIADKKTTRGHGPDDIQTEEQTRTCVRRFVYSRHGSAYRAYIIFGAFSKTYVGIKINRIADFEAREYELMTMCYFALIVVSIFTSTAGLNRALFESGDLDALITMPFSSNELFLSKLSSVYLRQAVVSLVFVTTINFTFFVSTSTLTVYGGLMSFVVALILPIVPIAISSMIVLPFYLIKRIVSAHYLAYFAVVTLVIALFCVGYSYVFDIAER